MIPSRPMGLRLLCVACLTWPAVLVTAEPTGSREVRSAGGVDIRAAIARQYPQARMLVRTDYNRVACEIGPEDPAFIGADFNGDGRQDFAVLLKTGETRSQDVGPSFPVWEIHLVVFQSVSGTQWHGTTLYRVEAPPPASVAIRLRPPGLIRESRALGQRVLRLDQAAIGLYFCDANTAVYYWDGTARKFVELWITD